MSKFMQVSVSTAIEPDGTRVREYAAVDDEGRAWRALDVGEPLVWDPMPLHPAAGHEWIPWSNEGSPLTCWKCRKCGIAEIGNAQDPPLSGICGRPRSR